MLRPMTSAAGAALPSTSAPCPPGAPNNHPGTWPSPPSPPKGRSSVWLSPAEYPSAEIVMSQTTRFTGHSGSAALVVELEHGALALGVQHLVHSGGDRGGDVVVRRPVVDPGE